MDEFDLRLLREHPDWCCVLKYYQTAALEAAVQSAPSSEHVNHRNDTVSVACAGDEDEDDDTGQNSIAGDTEDSLSPKGPRWFSRVATLDDVDPTQLSSIHGQLIALGWLKVQVEDRSSGLTYRISAEGRQALLKAAETNAA